MENPENKYQRGKIYKLISNQTDDVYYGSTIEAVLTNRLSGHRKSYKGWLNGKYHYVSSFEIVKFDDAKIILVESFPCYTKYELTAREQYYIDNNKCVNINKAPGVLSLQEWGKQYREENKNKIKECNKQYYNDRREYILQKVKQYRDTNKEKISEYKRMNKEKILEHLKQYRQDNRTKLLQEKKQRYEEQKENLKEKITCVCGSTIRKTDIRKHEKTLKHQTYCKSLEN